jgi:hypothetical protein
MKVGGIGIVCARLADAEREGLGHSARVLRDTLDSERRRQR